MAEVAGSAPGPATLGPQTALCFTLKHWCLWQSQPATDACGWPGGEVLPCGSAADVGFLPMMQRRRLSPLAKAAIAVAWRCRDNGGDMPSVFFSRHGECLLYFQMLEGLASGEEVSPSRFSLSVHNAIAGLFSFFAASHQPYVSLAGGTEGIFAAFLEAAGLLLESPRVLLVGYGQPLPEAYCRDCASDDCTWALGMVLGREDEPGWKLRLLRSPTAAFGPDDGGQALALAAREGWLSAKAHVGRAVWRWSLGDA